MGLAIQSTTNNQAEYFGLVTGLRFAAQQRLQPLSIIGDSAMVVTQMKQHRASLSPVLRELYGHARIPADILRVTDWRHHVRAYNKMADAAANLAMDSRSSTQVLYPTARSGWAVLSTHLNGDVAQWQASTHPGHD